MQTHRIISGLTIFVMIVLVAAGYFLVAQPQLAAASTASAQLVDTQSQIASTQAALTSLKSEQQKLPSLKKQLKALQMSIPSNIDGADYIRGLNALAGAAGVTITSIKVGDPAAYVSVAPIVAADSTGAASTASPTPAPSASPTTPAASGWTPTTDPLVNSSNFVDIPVTVAVSGTFDAGLAFIKGLQTGGRLFLVTGITTKQGNDGSGTVATTITGYIYALIDPKAAAAEAAAEKAAASATPTPTPTPSSTVTPNPSGSSTPTPTTSPTP
ncbi:MAG: hypothetical protein ABIS08_00070 [Pseudolysinimonas sp.]